MNKDDLKIKLTSEEFHITQEKGTEAPFTGEYYNHYEDGMYTCTVCGAELFASACKYDSGSGWPSFTKPSDTDAVSEDTDTSHGMVRTEATCHSCGAHLGHVFPDGPREGEHTTGQRYCINSASLKFKEVN